MDGGAATTRRGLSRRSRLRARVRSDPGKTPISRARRVWRPGKTVRNPVYVRFAIGGDAVSDDT